jgi:hypothetical protein
MDMERPRSRGVGRALLAGAVGGIAWLAALALVFTPAQRILADPARQSAKFIAAFATEPLPRMAAAPWIMPIALVLIGLGFGLAYHWIGPAWSGSTWSRGRRFGLVAWLIAIPWFEFYLPFNVMREPFALVAVELVCWFIVFQVVGAVIALVYHGRIKKGHSAAAA